MGRLLLAGQWRSAGEREGSKERENKDVWGWCLAFPLPLRGALCLPPGEGSPHGTRNQLDSLSPPAHLHVSTFLLPGLPVSASLFGDLAMLPSPLSLTPPTFLSHLSPLACHLSKQATQGPSKIPSYPALLGWLKFFLEGSLRMWMGVVFLPFLYLLHLASDPCWETTFAQITSDTVTKCDGSCRLTGLLGP